MVDEITTAEQKAAVDGMETAKNAVAREGGCPAVSGVFTGAYAGIRLAVLQFRSGWIMSFGYGTGAVMAVPQGISDWNFTRQHSDRSGN